MAITDAWLRATNGKPYSGKTEISHRFGLGVRVSPKGKITWVYRANINGKMQRIKLGEYPAMKLRDAIQARESRAELVELGFDPRKSTRSANDDSIITLNDLIDYWAENHARDNIKQCDALLKMFHTDITPTLGNYPAKQLELIDFMPVFLKAKRRVSAKHSANLMTRFKQVLSYAVRHGLLKYNVLTELKKADVGVPTTPKRSRQDEQGVKALWKAIDDISIHES
ncbi:integrase arm-type DNA-binding domain-containing protein, partial [Vibrio cholerae]